MFWGSIGFDKEATLEFGWTKNAVFSIVWTLLRLSYYFVIVTVVLLSAVSVSIFNLPVNYLDLVSILVSIFFNDWFVECYKGNNEMCTYLGIIIFLQKKTGQRFRIFM